MERQGRRACIKFALLIFFLIYQMRSWYLSKQSQINHQLVTRQKGSMRCSDVYPTCEDVSILTVNVCNRVKTKQGEEEKTRLVHGNQVVHLTLHCLCYWKDQSRHEKHFKIIATILNFMLVWSKDSSLGLICLEFHISWNESKIRLTFKRITNKNKYSQAN